MRSFFRTAAVAIALLAAGAAPLLALSDAEYKKMLKNPEFARADRALNNAWNRAKKMFPNTKEGKAAYRLLLDDQKEWLKNGRDNNAKDLMGMEGYSKIKAYAFATKDWAEYLPTLAREYLEQAGVEEAPAKKNEPQKKRDPDKKKDEPKPDSKPKPKSKPKTDNGGYPTETARRIAAGDWTDNYPDTGYCTGNGVRIREEPDTSVDNVLGKLNDGDMIMVIGETSVDGNKWYEIDNPFAEGSAFISADYVETYKGYEVGTPAYETLMQIFLNFGVSPTKTKVLLGKPDRELTDEVYFEPANAKIHQDIFKYFNGVELQYLGGKLTYVSVSEPGMAFGEVSVGDPVSKLTEVFGSSDSVEGGERSYEATPRANLIFVANDNGRIVEMRLEEYFD